MSSPDPRPAAPGAASASDRNLRFNFLVLLVHGFLGQTGFRLLQTPTFLPAYLSVLGGNRAVGIARAVQSLGMFLSPVLSARMVEHRSHAKGLALVFGGTMRTMILLLGLAALLLPHPDANLGSLGWTVVLVWLVIAGWGFANGLQMVVFNVLLSKTIPTPKRGRLLGARNSSAGVTLLFVSILGGVLVDRFGFPSGYGWTFILAFVLTSLGLATVALLREPTAENPPPSLPLKQRLGDIPTLLRAEPNFARFVVARLIATGARSARPFYIIYAGEQFGLSGGRLAGLTIAFALAESSSAILWGLLADRAGFRAVFMGALTSWMAGTALLLAWPSVTSTYIVFILVGSGFGGFMMASHNMVLEFGTQRDRALRIATTNSLSEAVGALSFVAAGFMAEAFPLPWLFATSITLQVIAILQMSRVREPRRVVADDDLLDVG